MLDSETKAKLVGDYVVTDLDNNPQAKALYGLIPILASDNNAIDHNIVTKLIQGGSNLIAGVGSFAENTATVTITIGKTMPAATYLAVATIADPVATELFIRIPTRTTTTFTARRGPDVITAAVQEFSWLIIY